MGCGGRRGGGVGRLKMESEWIWEVYDYVCLRRWMGFMRENKVLWGESCV